MNAIRVISPYKFFGTWVFDDPVTGLVREPFVAGMPAMIDDLVRHIPDAGNGFLMLFSSRPFPGWERKLTWDREEDGGNWYVQWHGGERTTGWLCPALFKYFDKAPAELYVQAQPAHRTPS